MSLNNPKFCTDCDFGGFLDAKCRIDEILGDLSHILTFFAVSRIFFTMFLKTLPNGEKFDQQIYLRQLTKILSVNRHQYAKTMAADTN